MKLIQKHAATPPPKKCPMNKIKRYIGRERERGGGGGRGGGAKKVKEEKRCLIKS